MPVKEAESVLSKARVIEFERGQTVFLQGEVAKAVYIVMDGWVKLYRIAPSGAEAVVGVFTKGRSFGEAVAFRGDVYPVSAEAVTNCALMRIEAEDYLRQIRTSPEAAISLLSATFAHLHNLVAQVEALKARTGAQRVAEFLCELSDCESGNCEVILPYDKVLIAGRLGMKPESLSRAFSKLKREGVTIQQNRAKIDDIAHLRVYSEEDPANAWTKP
ncbi:Crp/Fnr family transcriptional regulator [Marimonas arenosa]|uniref:Crp/Fnr family transcriptional regulator n=1 Tax=Marimonas arenosa TaxID=1795305 RepID=A0AAE3WH97_9RHOB|nr:Crp/Fnr family transcriptional regulator [Marimonas arenosa]MDQ2091787.1 Crp/Fnr family transcriptional regulator [Marimonas arenosa]